MNLFIDTTHINTIFLRIGEKEFTVERAKNSQSVLPLIENSLQDLNLSLSDITEIETQQGPGSFTGLRVGVSIAQTLGWVLGVPVNGKRVDKGEVVTIVY